MSVSRRQGPIPTFKILPTTGLDGALAVVVLSLLYKTSRYLCSFQIAPNNSNVVIISQCGLAHSDTMRRHERIKLMFEISWSFSDTSCVDF